MKHDSVAKNFADVIVVGAGHAGLEAAAACSRLGVSTLLVSKCWADIGSLSCNPAVGGIGKGQIVREIDVLDGLLPKIADKAAIHHRLLNRSRGPAVHSPRAQMDRRLFQKASLRALQDLENVRFVEGLVDNLIVTGQIARGCVINGQHYYSSAIVLATGTFLGGRIFIGSTRVDGGRYRERPSEDLGRQLRELGFDVNRLKTGTPPRLLKSSIDFDALTPQPTDMEPYHFSSFTESSANSSVNCHITHTTEPCHAIIRRNLSASPLYDGSIEGRGPRYCPSIEDKVSRFADKASHQIFLEPEGIDSDTIYPNGISTSLDPSVQMEFVRSIPGLERAVITQPGYAVEYDFCNPNHLTLSLESKSIPGLFFAGQINGTTGYEEAAGQGLVAGVNAALKIKGDLPLALSRTNSYIGVLLDDLTSRPISEPYRIFTSRSEFRLSLRLDNCERRLGHLGLAAGCLSDERRKLLDGRLQILDRGRSALKAISLSPSEWSARGISIKLDGLTRSAYDIIGSKFDERVVIAARAGIDIDSETLRCLAIESLYRPYERRESADSGSLHDMGMRIPNHFYDRPLPGISREVFERLCFARPETVGHAAKLEGITPASLIIILAVARRAHASS